MIAQPLMQIPMYHEGLTRVMIILLGICGCGGTKLVDDSHSSLIVTTYLSGKWGFCVYEI